jgi:hypothetical protein
MIPTFDSLLKDTHNAMVLTLLYCLAEWHTLAKLHMHTENTLTYLEELTTRIGKKLHNFQDQSLQSFKCQELPKETAAQQQQQERVQAKKATNNLNSSQDTAPTKAPPKKKKKKTLNLFT